MAGDALLWSGAIAAGASVALLRFAWGQARRSMALNGAGWGLLLLALVLGALAAGAWGMAVVSSVATLAAFVALAQAAIGAPPSKATASNRRANILPQTGEPLRIGGRLLTFLISGPLALIASFLIAMAGRIVADKAGAHEANSNALVLLLMPVVWMILASALLMWPARRTQLVTLAVPGLASAGLLAMSIVR